MVRVQGQNNTGHHALATGMRKATEGTPQALIRMLTSMCGFLVADFFEPADDFGTKMRKVLPRFGTVFFAINDGLSWGIDFLRVFSRRRAFRELFFTLWTLSSLFNAVAVAAYVYLRCTRRSPPALTALVVFSWTAGNAVGSAITFRQNALCILTAVILSNVALATNIPGRWAVVVLNVIIAIVSTFNSGYDDSLFLAQKSDDWSPAYVIVFVVLANAMISLYLALFHSAYAESLRHTQHAAECAQASATLAACIARALSHYDTDTVDAELRANDPSRPPCDPNLVASLLGINEMTMPFTTIRRRQLTATNALPRRHYSPGTRWSRFAK